MSRFPSVGPGLGADLVLQELVQFEWPNELFGGLKEPINSHILPQLVPKQMKNVHLHQTGEGQNSIFIAGPARLQNTTSRSGIRKREHNASFPSLSIRTGVESSRNR